jgi:D-arabinose 1-dehydrogenase-like Zn-dependent alcohol dehydrogenase
VFALQLEILGSTMGTPEELGGLLALLAKTGVRPVIDSVHPFSDARAAFERLHSGDVFGKVVLDHTA